MHRRLSVRQSVFPLLGKEGPRIAVSRGCDQALLRHLLLSARTQSWTEQVDCGWDLADDARSLGHRSSRRESAVLAVLHRILRQEIRAARMEQRRDRSEERRVGKECRSRWSPYH